jgi:hypothetical protein
MSGLPVVPVSNSGLTLGAYPGDGAVLLGFSLEPSVVKNNMAGFAIQCTPPSGQPYFLLNRLSFTQPVTSGTTPQQRPFTSSNDAPFQKFHWVHFPPDVTPGATGSQVYKYKVITRFCQGTALADGPSAEVTVDLNPQAFSNFELGVTRGYISSQAYASKFHNADIRPTPKNLTYNTQPFQPQYEWLGFHARKMIFDLLDQCLNDPSITVDLFAYDIDEPDIVKKLQALGPRLRAFLDNAPLHTGTALEVQVHSLLATSAGAANVKQGHFKRFAHDKIIIAKKEMYSGEGSHRLCQLFGARPICAGQQRDALQRPCRRGLVRTGFRVRIPEHERLLGVQPRGEGVPLPQPARRSQFLRQLRSSQASLRLTQGRAGCA